MKDLNKKEEQFYLQWQEQRKKKWLFVFLYGSIYFGLSIAVLRFIIKTIFDVQPMYLQEFLFSIIFFGIGGIPMGLFYFRQREKFYLSLKDNNEIEKGIHSRQESENTNI